MDAFLLQFQHLKIQLEEITAATNNFDDQNNYIGGGGFGKVYKGEVSHSEGRSMVAIKRLDRRYGQGIPEFLKEITMLSRYRHENLISLLGFCYQGDEMILVYEHASRGSLDRHLSSPHLRWSQRLNICLDAAKGLSYLHDPRETHQRLIHCDIKSANILVNEQWSAKVSDFGLSIMGPAKEQDSVIVTFAAGTHGYCDPQYAMTHTLTKESDVYSFGVVLFEVLCGTLCCRYSNGRVQRNLVPTWIESYKQKKLNDIIFTNPTIQPLCQSSLETFSDIACQCLKESREDRPKMAEVVTELEAALEIQELSEGKFPSFIYEEITPHRNNSSNAKLWKILCEGVLLNGGKTLFSLNKKGEHCEMVSFAECLDPGPSEFNGVLFKYDSRFSMGTYLSRDGIFKIRVNTQFLSPLITYTLNLVFKFVFTKNQSQHLIYLKYKLQGETKTSISYLAYKREDGWWMCELYQFTSDHRTVDLEILFEGSVHQYPAIEIDGIEFRPLEKMEDNDEKQHISDSDTNWDEKLPADYEDIMKWSNDSVQCTTKKEAYSIIRNGFLISDDKIWFSLDQNGKKCLMLSQRGTVYHYAGTNLPLPESRFGEAIQCASRGFYIETEVQSQLVSSETTYATYLVYKVPKDQSGFEGPFIVWVKTQHYDSNHYSYIYLASTQTPVIKPKADQNTHNPVNRSKTDGIPQLRIDGWTEVKIWEFQTATTTEMIHMRLDFGGCCRTNDFSGLIIEGVEFRPI